MSDVAVIKTLKKLAALEQKPGFYEAEIAGERGLFYVGCRRISPVTVTRLLTLLAISEEGRSNDFVRYRINGVGRAILERPAIIADIKLAIAKGTPFTVCDACVFELAAAPRADGER